ncbi:MAG: rRNA methyltransferase [Cellvibrionaceae bacterium]|nr:rRNA methyltransferase [Cellvibrionaceae bacterium]|tara:strand:+ start:30354 stop:31421 length:1068 start_codon:yes stop_codon:yes gene_type:complete
MNDSVSSLLLNFLQNNDEQTLWIADENALGTAATVSPRPSLVIVSNRFDIYTQAIEQGHNAQFSDYDFSAIEDESLDAIAYRVSKERAVVHHVANEARRTLKPGGILRLVGEKYDGIKGYTDKISKLLGVKSPAKKYGNSYVAELKKSEQTRADTSDKVLDDKQYAELRQIDQLISNQGSELAWWSKPGQFGWNKTDQGSALLIQQAEVLFAQTRYPSRVMDLGCGYGYLTLMTTDWPHTLRFATDNNAAAIASAKRNFEAAGLNVTLVADDCGSSIQEEFDCLLCNPPFHQGFAHDSSLTQKFLANAARLTATQGVALFVVNQFIPLEKMAAKYFRNIDKLVDDGHFKVVALKH